jgi:hypothetical protein
MSIHFHSGGCGIFFAAIMLVALFAAITFHSALWLIGVPVGLFVLLIVLGKWGPKRKVSPQQFADELESHLLGMGGGWDWDDTTSISIADKRLDKLRSKLHKFDNIALPEWRIELTEIIAALRRGEIPDVKPD